MFNNIISIINFYKQKKAFLIYFTNNFWRYILNYYNEPTQENIEICFKLREIFIQYYDLVLYVFDKKDAKFIIKKEAYNYFERDEFALLLDQKIRSYNNNSKATYIEKLRAVCQCEGELKCENGHTLKNTPIECSKCEGTLYWIDGPSHYCICNRCEKITTLNGVICGGKTGCGANAKCKPKFTDFIP